MKPSIPAGPRGPPATRPGEVLCEKVLSCLESQGVPRPAIATALGGCPTALVMGQRLVCKADHRSHEWVVAGAT